MGAAGLTREAVVDAAAELAAERGYDGLSMRTLADRLDVAPMTLYRHVRTKEDLLAALADRLLAELRLPEPGDWQADLIAIFSEMHRLLLANPELAEVTLRQPIAGANAYRGAEAALDALRRGGIEGDAATSAFAALTVFTQGFTLQQIHASHDQLGERLAVLEALEDVPNLRRIGPSFLLRDSDRHFDEGLAALLRGYASS